MVKAFVDDRTQQTLVLNPGTALPSWLAKVVGTHAYLCW